MDPPLVAEQSRVIDPSGISEPRSKAWKQARERGCSLAETPDLAIPLLDQATNEIYRLQGRVKVLEPVREDLETLIRMSRASLEFRYIGASEPALPLSLAAISYFVSTDDAIPDFIPVIGYQDDAAVIAYVADQLKEDLQAFRDWESSRTRV